MVGWGFLKIDLWSYIVSTDGLMPISLPASLARQILLLAENYFPLDRSDQIRSVQEWEKRVYYKESVDQSRLGLVLDRPVVTELNSLYNFHHQLPRQHPASNINHSPESILFNDLCPSVWSSKKGPGNQGKLIHHIKLQYFVIRGTGREGWWGI